MIPQKLLLFVLAKSKILCYSGIVILCTSFSPSIPIMKVKELLLPLVFALTSTFILQYFFSSRKGESAHAPTAGQRFMAPAQEEVHVHKPLLTSVDFVDKPSYKKPVISVVETELARYKFSTDGASLEQFEFKRPQEAAHKYLTTIFAPATADRQKRCFLVALDRETPYYYTLQNLYEREDAHEIVYEIETDLVRIRKEFTVYKNSYQVDIHLSLEPKGAPLQPRLFFPSPVLSTLGSGDTIKAVVADAQDKIQVYDNNPETLQGYWVQPPLFGCQDRYFVHALTKDPQNFTQRGYFKIFEADSLYAILEGPEITTPTSWHLTFYFGPKENNACHNCDPRLIQVLNYGFLKPISRPLSTFLLTILNAIYSYVHNYGWAIIILTILMKLLLLPFSWKGEQSMKKRMEFQKKLDYIQSKYKHDKEALYAAREELVRHHGVPGMAGCLPILLQFPLFITLSWVLANSIELYQAPFLWIPDLAAPDPYYILPLLLVVAMMFQLTSLNTKRDPRQKFITVIIALIAGWFIGSFSSGLVMYIIVSTALSVLQQTLTQRIS